MIHLNLELSSCLVLLVTGMVLGGFFDLYRTFRSTVKVNKLFDFMGDLIFWVLALILITPLVYWGTWLELRLYVWLLLLAGLVLYFLVFSKSMLSWYLRFWRGMSWLPKNIMKFLWHIWMFIRKLV